jgi:tryptophan-rich sensory protein
MIQGDITAGDWLVLLALVVLCQGIGFLGAFWTMPAVRGWYPTLRKPSWNPPAWVFGPVWTVLYFLMATSAWVVWRRTGWADPAMALFGVQLVLNLVWSLIFFRLRRPGAAFGEILLLWVLIVLTGWAFYQISTVAALLWLPYVLWSSFAVVLNGTIWQMNRGQLERA